MSLRFQVSAEASLSDPDTGEWINCFQQARFAVRAESDDGRVAVALTPRGWAIGREPHEAIDLLEPALREALRD